MQPEISRSSSKAGTAVISFDLSWTFDLDFRLADGLRPRHSLNTGIASDGYGHRNPSVSCRQSQSPECPDLSLASGPIAQMLFPFVLDECIQSPGERCLDSGFRWAMTGRSKAMLLCCCRTVPLIKSHYHPRSPLRIAMTRMSDS